MTMEIKKPSEAIAALTHADWLRRGGDTCTPHDCYGIAEIVAYLDSEHERRAKFEADVLGRLKRLEVARMTPLQLLEHYKPGAKRDL